MGTTIVARFADGRLLVQESRTAVSAYGTGLQIRVGHIGHVEKIVSVSTNLDKYGLVCKADELTISNDIVTAHLRRGDLGAGNLSGAAGITKTIGTDGGLLSGITSGLAWMAELVSGAKTSGFVTVTLNVIGH